MRAYKSEEELRAIAKDISKTYIGRDDYNPRDATLTESEIIYKIAYGALLSLRYMGSITTPQTDQAVLNTAEFTLNLFLPNCQCYDTLYCPLRRVLYEWPEE